MTIGCDAIPARFFLPPDQRGDSSSCSLRCQPDRHTGTNGPPVNPPLIRSLGHSEAAFATAAAPGASGDRARHHIRDDDVDHAELGVSLRSRVKSDAASEVGSCVVSRHSPVHGFQLLTLRNIGGPIVLQRTNVAIITYVVAATRCRRPSHSALCC